MAKPSRSDDGLQQLLDERNRYEQWIATLESRRESTPEHVFKRVHADYEQRLAGVRQQLTERTGEVRSAISGLKDRLKQASEQEAERVDEMHEAELRSVVGELTPEQWELRKREVEVELTRFADDKKKISEELNQLLLIIEQTTDHGIDAEPAAPAPPAPATPSVPSAPHAPSAPHSPSAPSASIESPPPPAAVPADATRVRSKTPVRPRAAMHNDSPRPVEPEKPPVPIESLAPDEVAVPPTAEPAKASDQSAPSGPSSVGSAQPRPDTPAAAPAKRSKSSGTAQPTDPRRENEKTLKCGECGAMNYPTEWYCESCGG
ncbi:MAG: hypothetical protein M3403_07940, partial [Gemmatimonadota bacterium]|nr:hypothetical protein [Gemmatimonadota bacterium]